MITNKNKVISALAFCLVILNSSIIYSQAQLYGVQTDTLLYSNPGNFSIKKIAILYDPINPNADETARAILETISFLYSNVQLIAVYTPTFFNQTFKEDFWVRIYVFNTDLTGIKTIGGTISWSKLAQYYNHYSDDHHIAVYGNSYKVKELVTNEQCYFEDKEIIDVRTAYLHAIWQLSEIFMSQKSELYKEIGKNFQTIAIQYFATEIENLFTLEFEPTYGLGVQDQEKAKERLDEFKKTHPNQLAKIHPETGELLDPTAKIDGLNPPLDLKPQLDADAEDDIILTDFPSICSISGAAGEIIRLLLQVIGVDIPRGVITVGEDFANAIKDIVNEIPKIIGLTRDPSSNTALEQFFDVLKSSFPSLQEYKPFFDIAARAIFAVREGPTAILDLIDDLLHFMIPENASSFITDVQGALNLTTEFWNEFLDSDNWSDTLMKHLNKQLIYYIMLKVANTVGGGLNNTSTVETITEMFDIAIEIISSKDYGAVVTDIIPFLGEKLLGGSLDSEASKMFEILGVLLQMGLGATGVLKVDFDESAKDLFEILFPDVDFEGEQAESLLDDLMSITKKVVEGDLSDYSSVITQLKTLIADIDALSSSVSLSTAESDVIAKSIALIFRLLQNNFQISSDVYFLSLIDEIIDAFYPSINSNTQTLVNLALELASSLIAFTTKNDYLKIFIRGSIGDFDSEIAENPSNLVKNLLQEIIPLISGETPDPNVLVNVGNIASMIVNMLTQGFDFAVQNILQTLVSMVGIGLSHIDSDIPLEVLVDTFNLIWSDQPEYRSVFNIVNRVKTAVSGIVSAEDLDIIELVLTSLGSTKKLYKDGVKWIMNQLVGWVAGKTADLLNRLTRNMDELIAGIDHFISFTANFSVGFGNTSAFYVGLYFELSPAYTINKEAIIDFINELVFHSSTILESDNLDYLFGKISDAISIIPLLTASIEVKAGTSGKDELTHKLLNSLGLELNYSGTAGVTLQLMKLTNGKIEMSDFLKLVQFFFKFEVSLTKKFPIAEFCFGPAVSVLSKVAEHLGLGNIYLVITFWIAIEIVKRMDTEFQKAADILTIIIGIGVSVVLDFSLVIVGIEISFGFAVSLAFIQDFLSNSPLRINLNIVITVSAKLTFILWDWTKSVSFGPDPINLAGGKENPETRSEMTGIDEDEDGLPDSYEEMIPGLNVNKADSDGDGLSDKFEIKTSGTDPTCNDTDGDYLLDGFEYSVIFTNPLQVDSDFDGLDDYNEVVILGTNPNCIDSDGDQLDDYYEVNTAWNISGITPSVKSVTIGGETYSDHTDPLNPDTDGDGILDGQEGPFGAYYGPELYDDEEDEFYPDQPPIIFNQGYIHPLDNDTDDDSYRQLCNGTIAPGNMFLIPMTDKVEIDGQWVIFIEGDELIPKLVRTNPVNPDSDGDTGIADPSWRKDGAPINIFLKSDGYELWLDPPTDPTDADSDDDGILDGLEGWGNPTGDHTNPNNADTDNDGLGDLQDILLGSDPLSPDSDHDGVLDGDEFFKYGTNPAYPDTDQDGLLDGEELFLFHTNPLSPDSDADGIEDGLEVLFYDTNPMDEDEDNDGLTDWEEIFYHGTLPKVFDSDNDGLSDYEEVAIYYTNPRNWDTDNDSIWYPNEYGKMTFPMSDGDEVKIYGTNPLSSDTDSDGIYDCLELYLGSGLIPNFDPILLNPNSNDTDHDGLLDAQEYLIHNVTNIIFPYRSFIIEHPFNTSVIEPDTDNDGLLDGEEILIYGTNANNTDTDGDSLTDYDEIFVYNTNPLSSDSDGDFLADNEEALVSFYPDYSLDPLDPDVDDDLLPDGAEILLYSTYHLAGLTGNPNNPDTNSNGVLDGLDFDNDMDGLEDGKEFFVYHTPEVAGGGVTQPDSDRDGLMDGNEVYLYGTNCTDWDTDNDLFSDGLEVMIGTDPLHYTSWEEYFEAITAYDKGIVVISPIQNGVYSPSNFTFMIYNASPVLDVSYQMRKGTKSFSDSAFMNYQTSSMTWMSVGDYIGSGNYEVIFSVHHPDDSYTNLTRLFSVTGSPLVSMTWVFVGIGLGGVAGVTATVFLFRSGKLGFLRRLFGGGSS